MNINFTKSFIKILILVAIVGVLIVPQTSFAAWWNPFTWKIFSRSTIPQKAMVASSTPQEALLIKESQELNDRSLEIEKLKKEIKELKKSTQSISAPNPQAKQTISSPKITYVNPAIVVVNHANIIEIHGSGFQKNAKIGFSNGTFLSAIEPILADLIKIELPANFLIPMVYYNIEVINSDGGRFLLGKAIETKKGFTGGIYINTPTKAPVDNLINQPQTTDYSSAIFQELKKGIDSRNQQIQSLIDEQNKKTQEMNDKLKPLEDEHARLQIEHDSKCPAGVLLTGELLRDCNNLTFKMIDNSNQQGYIINQYGGNYKYSPPPFLPSYQSWQIDSLPGEMNGTIWSAQSSQRFQYECLSSSNCTVFSY